MCLFTTICCSSKKFLYLFRFPWPPPFRILRERLFLFIFIYSVDISGALFCTFFSRFGTSADLLLPPGSTPSPQVLCVFLQLQLRHDLFIFFSPVPNVPQDPSPRSIRYLNPFSIAPTKTMPRFLTTFGNAQAVSFCVFSSFSQPVPGTGFSTTALG